MLQRHEYISQIDKWLGKDLVIVLTGQRRVGKSCLLKLLCQQKAENPKNNIIYIDKEKHQFDSIATHSQLNEYIEQHRAAGCVNYILIDEVQEIAEFERSLRNYCSEPDTEVIVTGSNAKMLSGELATIIGGRYKEIYIHPLSYSEFLSFHGMSDSDDALASYLQYGGMPGLQKIGLSEDFALEYLQDIYHTVLLKDVILRNNIRNATFLENLALFIADNIGKPISAYSIARYMKSQGESINPTTILEYIRYLCEAFIMRSIKRYDLHGKRLFDSNHKYYFEDHGLRNAIVGGSREGDIEKIIENVVLQHLLRMGYQVTVGQLRAGEIDFVCTTRGGGRIYLQASYVIVDSATREREFGNLQAIDDNYPKYVVSMTPLVTKTNNNGIIHLHLRQFLLSKSL